MKAVLAVALIPFAAACTPPGTSADVTRVVNRVPPEVISACIAATAAEAGVPQALVSVTEVRPETTGPALIMDAGGEAATCKADAEGEITSLTFA